MRKRKSELLKLGYEVAVQRAAWPVLPIIVIDSDSGQIVYLSKYAADIFGYEEDELLGEQLEILVPDDLSVSHSIWRKDLSLPKTRLMGQGRQVKGRRKDGSIFRAHVGITETEAMGCKLGVAYVVDLSGIV